MPIRLNIERLRSEARTRGHNTDTLISIATGISPATISQLSRPDTEREPKVATFRALGQPYDLSVDDLILDEGENAEQSPGVAA